jgi:hypothetical protein
VFVEPSSSFVERWNALGLKNGLGMSGQPPPGTFTYSFTSYIGLEGNISDAGRVTGYTLMVVPTQKQAQDDLSLQAFGVAIRTADPTLDGPGAASVLVDLGLNPRDPVIDPALNGSTTVNGIDYTLVYDESRKLLSLSVRPATS